MAQRRMTSLEVTGTDAFLDMPQSSQLLYFHLNSLADDDGFVSNPKSVMRNCGSQADDLKLLIAKKFVIAFDDGVCVIKHWRINNFIRKDIYKATKYLDLKRTLFIRANGAYTLNDDGQAIPVPEGHFQIEDVNVTLTSRQPRLGKVREDKNNDIAEQSSATSKKKDEKPFIWSEWIKSLEDSDRRELNVIAHYFVEKKIKFDTREKANSALRRHLRAAKEVSKFDDEEIIDATDRLKREFPNYTVETIYKQLTK